MLREALRGCGRSQGIQEGVAGVGRLQSSPRTTCPEGGPTRRAGALSCRNLPVPPPREPFDDEPSSDRKGLKAREGESEGNAVFFWGLGLCPPRQSTPCPRTKPKGFRCSYLFSFVFVLLCSFLVFRAKPKGCKGIGCNIM